MVAACEVCHTHVHGQDAAGNELSVLSDGKVPRLDPHQVIEGKLQYQTTLCTNLDRDHMSSVTSHSSSYSHLKPAGRRQLIWRQTNQKSAFIDQA